MIGERQNREFHRGNAIMEMVSYKDDKTGECTNALAGRLLADLEALLNDQKCVYGLDQRRGSGWMSYLLEGCQIVCLENILVCHAF